MTNRTPARKLNRSSAGRLESRLAVYVTAASAVGLGVAAAKPASAQVVYTPTHILFGPETTYNLDVDHNGTTDFVVYTAHYFEEWGILDIAPGSSNFVRNGVLVNNSVDYNPLALTRGERIGAGRRFAASVSSFQDMMAFTSRLGGFSGGNGYFVNVDHRYVGLKFLAEGEVHYGWARFSVHVNSTDFRVDALLSGYAYEATPNKPIRAGQTAEDDAGAPLDPDSRSPENVSGLASAEKAVSRNVQPASLGLLALGAQGIPLWRVPASANH